MDEGEPRLRRRGMFVHVETPELDQVEHESAEGIAIRRVPDRKRASRSAPSSADLKLSPTSLSPTVSQIHTDTNHIPRRVEFKSESATGTHRQARMNR